MTAMRPSPRRRRLDLSVPPGCRSQCVPKRKRLPERSQCFVIKKVFFTGVGFSLCRTRAGHAMPLVLDGVRHALSQSAVSNVARGSAASGSAPAHRSGPERQGLSSRSKAAHRPAACASSALSQPEVVRETWTLGISEFSAPWRHDRVIPPCG